MKKKWILVDIGCIECGEESKFVGFYNSEQEAHDYWYNTYVNKTNTEWGRPEWSGQHGHLVEEVGDDKWELFF